MSKQDVQSACDLMLTTIEHPIDLSSKNVYGWFLGIILRLMRKEKASYAFHVLCGLISTNLILNDVKSTYFSSFEKINLLTCGKLSSMKYDFRNMTAVFLLFCG